MRRALAAVALGLAFALFPGPAHAQFGERIVDYDVTLVVDARGHLLVTEEIAYDFGANERHGIFRDIPVRLHYDRRHDRIFPIDDVQVDGSPGTPTDVELIDIANDKRIRIGDEDRTITGRHRYRIRYRVRGALNGFDDHDELYWNSVGLGWGVPIESVEVRVTVPAEITQVACFSGPAESRLSCGSADHEGRSAVFTQAGLGPHEDVTVVVGFPPAAVPPPRPILDERWTLDRAFSIRPSTVGAASAALVVLVGAFVLLAWRHGRDRRFVGSPVDVAFGTVSGETESVPMFERTETPVEFVPPDGLRPGQVGTLVDECANPLDVTATIVDLAVRGYLRIEEIEKEGWFGKPDWRLVKLRDGDDLLPYERSLFDGLFEDASEVELSDLRNRFATRMRKVQRALYDDAMDRKWFLRRPDHVRIAWRVLGVVVLVAGIGLTIVVAAFTHWALVPVPLAIFGLLLVVGAGRMPSRTAAGTGALRRVLGFRRFIEESEKERARFAEQKHLFTEYLPYAVVFGATEKWARAFAGLDDELPAQTWYVGHHPFSVLYFSNAMDGFAVSTAGTLTSTPAGSGGSGFGGGGFSGGGGGGGGGGSW